jgi:poly(3-hydroxybutyrate) depolymerase
LPYYLWYELNHAALRPARAVADATRLALVNPLNPLSRTPVGRTLAASCELFERMTRRYGKPAWNIDETVVDGETVPVTQHVVWDRPFCRLLHFEKSLPAGARPQPKLLIVAPLSGHYATLLRGTVRTMLPEHDVYITDWVDARMVPIFQGGFDLDDYIDYLIEMLHALGGDTHMMAVCQPSVPVLAAAAVMSERDDPYRPRSMTLMGGPIDTREAPTAVNKLAQERGLDWFRDRAIVRVPPPNPGFMRDVYPGFLQLSGFMSMNLDRHLSAHRQFFQHLVQGDGDGAEKHREFYDEYLSVMDLTAEFYLQTVEKVFIDHALPKGEFTHRDRLVDPGAITDVALMTVEGERDDISGLGQTKAAHRLCANLPDGMKQHYMQPRVGHYGVFNGSRFDAEIAPRIRDFIRAHDPLFGASRDAARTSAPASKPAKPNGKAAPESMPAQLAGEAKSLDRSKPTQEPAQPSAAAVAKAQSRPVDVVEAEPAQPSNDAGNKAAASKPAASSANAANGAERDSDPAHPFLKAPRGEKDDLTVIAGIGAKTEERLNEIGVFHVWQIAGWTPEDAKRIDGELEARGRVERDAWVEQAKRLVEAEPPQA